MKKVLSIVFIAALMLSISAAAFAAETAGGEPPAFPQQMPDNGMQLDNPESVFIDFDAMVSQGVISQETCDRIKTYMSENQPYDLPETGAASGEMGVPSGEMNAPFDEMNGVSPEMDGEVPSGGMPEIENMDGENGETGGILGDLLKSGIITQDEYDALIAASEQ